MHFSIIPIPSIVLLATTVICSSLTITIPPSNLLPNPNVLPAGTHATLTSLPSSSSSSQDQTTRNALFNAPLTCSATFVFRNLQPSAPTQPASYLLDIRSAEYVFAPYRVDVAADGKVLGAWETFRGNPWDNRGAEKFNAVDAAARKDATVEAKLLAKRGFYEQRSSFSPLSLVKNPMILLALVALGFMFGMPKLMENMDPEMRAEFEKHSRSSPITGGARSAMSGGGGGGPGNFDLAGWMAGTAPGPMASAEAAAQSAATGRESGVARRRG